VRRRIMFKIIKEVRVEKGRIYQIPKGTTNIGIRKDILRFVEPQDNCEPPLTIWKSRQNVRYLPCPSKARWCKIVECRHDPAGWKHSLQFLDEKKSVIIF